ncbi:hypothetical protein [Streptomyces mirabilis]|uniref:hypothetical protein n=1 Tax=Streptomyces mirabilis TaxID=68239 RepID=UPI0033B6536C
MENTADIERGVRIMHKGAKYGTYIGEKLLPVTKDKDEVLGLSCTRSAASSRRSSGPTPHTQDTPTS